MRNKTWAEVNDPVDEKDMNLGKMILILVPAIYAVFLVSTLAMLMFGDASMKLDPFFHAPLIWFLG